MRLFTVGHSTLALAEFLALVRAHEIARIVDVRAYPASRRHPHFAREPLERELGAHGIDYAWLGRELGGRREPRGEASRHTALRDAAFRAYAEHMESALFAEGIEELLALARESRVAAMCAERDWSACHRSFLADHLQSLRGIDVVHVLDLERTEPHRVKRTARTLAGQLVYDRPDGAAQAELF